MVMFTRHCICIQCVIPNSGLETNTHFAHFEVVQIIRIFITQTRDENSILAVAVRAYVYKLMYIISCESLLVV